MTYKFQLENRQVDREYFHPCSKLYDSIVHAYGQFLKEIRMNPGMVTRLVVIWEGLGQEMLRYQDHDIQANNRFDLDKFAGE